MLREFQTGLHAPAELQAERRGGVMRAENVVEIVLAVVGEGGVVSAVFAGDTLQS